MHTDASVIPPYGAGISPTDCVCVCVGGGERLGERGGREEERGREGEREGELMVNRKV